MARQGKRIARLAMVAAMTSAALGACVKAPQTPPPGRPVAPPQAFAAVAGQAVETDHWWTLWGDPALDAMVDRALAANPDLRAARAHVAAARALVSGSEAALYPTVAASGAAWASASNTAVDGPLGTLIDPYTQGTTAGGHLVGLGAQWEPDVFGGRHADIATAQALAGSVAWVERGVRLTLVADVVENYQQMQGLRRRLALLDDAVAQAERLVAYAAARQRTGEATVLDVSRAQAALERLGSGRAPLVALIDVRRRRLAVLAGDLPEFLAAPGPVQALHLPPAPGGQLPSTVLARRPDVRIAMALVAARAARLKSLKADLMPRFGIGFTGLNGKLALSGLPAFGGTLGLVGIKASVPIFTGGLLRARIVGGNAELDAALAGQDRAVLSALEEVEGAYGLRSGLDARLEGLRRAQGLSERRAEQAQAFYKAGRVTLGDVLQARLDTLDDADRTEQAGLAAASATVQLYRAIAGGWSEQEQNQ